MSFFLAAASLGPDRNSRLARLIWVRVPLPSDLTEDEKTFCFGLSLFEEYEDRDAIRAWLNEE